MTDRATIARIDAAITLTGVLIRAGAYALVGSVASRYACGQAILTGLFLGDVAASLLRVVLPPRELLAQSLAELGLLAVVYLWARADLVWPADTPTRAILGLAALGVFAGRVGGTAMTRFGPSEDGFA
ncbi:MAG: hypothetical protein KAI24_11560 [Planctomycetes bacterium]|nr:hypothetical protein [Planctomycetota bacterium]